MTAELTGSSEDSSFKLDRHINDLLLHYIVNISPFKFVDNLYHFVSPLCFLISCLIFLCFRLFHHCPFPPFFLCQEADLISSVFMSSLSFLLCEQKQHDNTTPRFFNCSNNSHSHSLLRVKECMKMGAKGQVG